MKHTPGAWVRDAYDIALIRCIKPRGHPEAKNNGISKALHQATGAANTKAALHKKGRK